MSQLNSIAMHGDSIVLVILFNPVLLFWGSIYSNFESIDCSKCNEIFMMRDSAVVKGFEYIIQGTK